MFSKRKCEVIRLRFQRFFWLSFGLHAADIKQNGIFVPVIFEPCNVWITFISCPYFLSYRLFGNMFFLVIQLITIDLVRHLFVLSLTFGCFQTTKLRRNTNLKTPTSSLFRHLWICIWYLPVQVSPKMEIFLLQHFTCWNQTFFNLKFKKL